MADDFTPERDASLGLIYRLNNLWTKADYYAESGLYDKWDWILDRIYCNLQYRHSMVEVKNEDNGKIDYILPPKDSLLFKYYRTKISTARRNFFHARNSLEKQRRRTILYYILLDKDMWLRKFMHALGLYSKEIEKRPGSTTYGSFGSKK